MLDSSLLPLHDDRARLRPLRHDDAAAFAEGTADPAVREHGHLPEPEYTPESVRAMIDRDAAPGLERGDLAVLAIADAATDSFAGSLVLFDVSEDSAEVGFWLHPRHRGSGLTGAALSLAADLARGSVLAALTARTAPENIASQRALAAAGFETVGREVGTAPSGESVELLHLVRHLTAVSRRRLRPPPAG
ncbi:RimJ/RimL family protein N-acetyltransferase [Prauserella isguenensis]|uniref:RimJ/RimL family protein N-acetyltransferase n=1 Tax=Prauserella isguenensis TaxID=1470180 RepID=A0A839RXR7_9PSEU|nr:GNAT family N-acetyltransferase [Prauserella isguenensis]MBB3049834.1 RimJ/RimL family protein N-acetyltransferase [Prauserella isguenensis]